MCLQFKEPVFCNQQIKIYLMFLEHPKFFFFLGGFRAILNEIKANAALNLLYRSSINLLKNLDILIEIT